MALLSRSLVVPLALCLPGLAAAQDFTVDSTDDLVDFDSSDGECAALTYGGPCTLRAAIMQANADQSAAMKTIYVPEGDYLLTITGTGGAESGDLDLDVDLRIEGDGQGLTVIDGNGMTVFDQEGGTGQSLQLEGLTLRGADDGVRADQDLTLTVEDVAFEENQRGIFVDQSARTAATTSISSSRFWANTVHGIRVISADLSVYGSTFEDNTGYHGPALSAEDSEVAVTSSSFTGNHGTGNGGALHLATDSDFTGMILDVQNNSVDGHGGGIFGGKSMIGTNLDIYLSTVSGNTAGGEGGGVHLFDGTLTAVKLTADDNVAATYGGGIFVFGDTNLDMVDLSGNTAQDGGGMYVRGDLVASELDVQSNVATQDGGGVYLENVEGSIEESSFAGNTADRHGGGLIFYGGDVEVLTSAVVQNEAVGSGSGVRLDTASTDADVKFSNSTISENLPSAQDEGIYVTSAELALFHATLSESSTPTADVLVLATGGSAQSTRSVVVGTCSGGAAMSSSGYNVSSDAGCNLTTAADIVTSATVLDPLTTPTGGTAVHPLAQNSPAIDIGGASLTTHDQNYQPRPVDGDGDGTAKSDAGAYEAQESGEK